AFSELRWSDTGPPASEAYLKESRAQTWYARRSEKEEIGITGLDFSGSFLRTVDAVVVRGFSELHQFQSLAVSSFWFSHELTGRIFLFDPNFRSGTDED